MPHSDLAGPHRGTQGIGRVAVLSSATLGGAGIATARLVAALRAQPGLTVDLHSAETLGGVLPAAVAPIVNLSNRRHTDTLFTLQYPGFRRDEIIERLAGYDLVNIHWSCYILSLAEIEALARGGTRILFWLHDFHYVTGGCHYPAGCLGMTRGCLSCPQADQTRCDVGFVPANLRVKQAIFAHPNVHLSAPSAWLRNRAVMSGIVPAERAHILRNPYAAPGPVLPHSGDGGHRIMVIADTLAERRKGVERAVEVANALADTLHAVRPHRQASLDLVGTMDEGLRGLMARCRLPHRIHGNIADPQHLAALYAACDIVLSCSTEDNWPNVLVEAGAQGCVPVVGPGHGCEEFAKAFGIGAVARSDSAADFTAALLSVIGHPAAQVVRLQIAQRVRSAHAPPTVAAQFLRIGALIEASASPT